MPHNTIEKRRAYGRSHRYPMGGVGADFKSKHVQVATKALGHPLPDGAIVHHVDEDSGNYRDDNLCILQSRAEHNSLHRRLRVLRAGGNPWTQMICKTCGGVFDFDQFCPSEVIVKSGRCRKCQREHVKTWKETAE